jgi:hypothetical protein
MPRLRGWTKAFYMAYRGLVALYETGIGKKE